MAIETQRQIPVGFGPRVKWELRNLRDTLSGKELRQNIQQKINRLFPPVAQATGPGLNTPMPIEVRNALRSEVKVPTYMLDEAADAPGGSSVSNDQALVKLDETSITKVQSSFKQLIALKRSSWIRYVADFIPAAAAGIIAAVAPSVSVASLLSPGAHLALSSLGFVAATFIPNLIAGALAGAVIHLVGRMTSGRSWNPFHRFEKGAREQFNENKETFARAYRQLQSKAEIGGAKKADIKRFAIIKNLFTDSQEIITKINEAWEYVAGYEKARAEEKIDLKQYNPTRVEQLLKELNNPDLTVAKALEQIKNETKDRVAAAQHERKEIIKAFMKNPDPSPDDFYQASVAIKSFEKPDATQAAALEKAKIKVKNYDPGFVLGSEITGKITSKKYEVVSKLGQGGMGTVYKVRVVEGADAGKEYVIKFPSITGILLKLADKTRERDAVKDPAKRAVLLKEIQNLEYQVRLFEGESEKLSKLNSTHIIKVLDYGRVPKLIEGVEEPVPYYIAPLIPGKNLDELAGRISTLDWLTKIFIPMVEALSVVHAAGITHRDVTPKNIMVEQFPDDSVEKATLIDFGTCTTEEGNMTGTGVRVGTAGFMDLDYFSRGRAGLTKKSDLLSLALTMFLAKAGKLPYDHVNTPFTRPDTLEGTPESIDIPPAVLKVINDLYLKKYGEKDHDKIIAQLRKAIPSGSSRSVVFGDAEDLAFDTDSGVLEPVALHTFEQKLAYFQKQLEKETPDKANALLDQFGFGRIEEIDLDLEGLDIKQLRTVEIALIHGANRPEIEDASIVAKDIVEGLLKVKGGK